MEYKNTIKEYKEYQKGYIKRCEMMFKAFGTGLPEPTDEDMETCYNNLLEYNPRLSNTPSQIVKLKCLLEYLSVALETMSDGIVEIKED